MKKLLISVLTLMLILCFGVASVTAFATSETEVVNFIDLPTKTYEANFGYVTGEYSDFSLKRGNVSDLKSFDNGGTNDLYLTAQGTMGVRAENWRWTITATDGIVAVFLVKKDCKIVFDKTDLGGWLEQTQVNFYLKQSNSEPILLKSKENATALEDFDLTVYAKAGDTVYFEFVTTQDIVGTRNMQKMQYITATFSAEFTDSDYNSQLPVVPGSILDFSTFATKTYGANFGLTESNFVNYGLKYGSVYNLKDFDDGLTENDIYTKEGGISGVRAEAWRWTITADYGIVAVLKANKDLKMVLTPDENVIGWFENTSLNTYIYRADQEKLVRLSEIVVPTKEELGGTYYLNEGDIFYYEFVATTQITTTRNYQKLPVATFSEDFDQNAYAEQFIVRKETLKLADLVHKSALNGNSYYQAENVDVNFKHGFLGFKLNYYNIIRTSKDGKDYFGLLNGNELFDKSFSGFETWRIKTHSEDHAIIEVVAKENLFLDISHPAVNGGWTDPKMGLYVGVYLYDGENYHTLVEKEAEAYAEANAYGASLSMKKGTKVYFVYASLMRSANINLAPVFTVETDKYVEDDYNALINGNDTVISMQDMVSGFAKTGYEKVESNSLIDYEFFYGDLILNDLYKFTYAQSFVGVLTDSLFNSYTQNVGFKRNEIKCTSMYDAIMKITVKENLVLSLTHAKLWEEPDVLDAQIRFVSQNSEGYMLNVLNKKLENGIPEGALSKEVHLKKGDSFYVIFSATGKDPAHINFMPKFTIDTSSYDESLRADYTLAKEISNYREIKIAELDACVSNLRQMDYSMSKWTQIQDLFTSTKNEILVTDDKTAIDNLVIGAKEEISAINTLEEDKLIIDALRQDKIKELEDYVASLDKSNYSKANWKKIKLELDAFRKKAELLENTLQFDKAILASKTLIDSIPIGKEGCNGNIEVICPILTLALFTGYILLRRKNAK